MKYIVFVLSLFLFSACSVEPEPIAYGHDECHVCRMTIVDTRYGTEAVTSKGKIYKFDSVECLLDFLNENPAQEFAHLMVTPYDKPMELVPAANTVILKSPYLPSPMGMGLTAFTSMEVALGFKEEFPGLVYTWQRMLESRKITVK